MGLLVAALLAPALVTPRLLSVDNLILGEYRNGKWEPLYYDSPRVKSFGTMTWHPIKPTSLTGRTLTSGIKVDTSAYVGVYLTNGQPNPSGVYLGGGKPLQPRAIESLPVTNPTYVRLLRRWLDSKGMKRSPARIKAIYRTDLDGDGTKEVLIEARSAEDLVEVGFHRKSNSIDYSLILLRSMRGGKLVETPLRFTRSNGEAGTSSLSKIRAIGDVDGDRRMEIVLSYAAWEVVAGELWSYRAGDAKRILDNGSAL